MTRYRFACAGENDNADLCRLLRETPMEGRVTLAFLREPDFFRAERNGSIDTQVVVVREAGGSNVVGCGTRGVRRAYIDGVERPVGYFGGLRLASAARNGTILARAYTYMRSLHDDRRVPYYLTTILNENVQVHDLLTSGRAGLPVYEPRGTFCTGLISLARRRRGATRSRVRVVREGADPCAVSDFLASRYRSLQFAPVLTEYDLQGAGHLDGVRWADRYVALEGHTVVGTVGVWDQHAFKQTVVYGYRGLLHVLRPFYNVIRRLAGAPTLPAPRSEVRTLQLVGCAADPGREDVLHALIDAVVRDWSGGEYHYLSVGFHERHPLVDVVLSRASRRLLSTLYLVYWKDALYGAELPSHDRVPHVEVGTL